MNVSADDLTSSDAPLLQVRNLCVEFATDVGVIRPVDGVRLGVERGRTLAIVGESGCGKSVTALAIMRLLPTPPARIAGGSIILRDEPNGRAVDLATAPETVLRRVRGNRVAMVFQEPMTSLNPVLSIGAQIVEAVVLHQGLRGRAAWDRAVEMLARVGIPAPRQRARQYPHQMSGGMQQRVMVAMALSCTPSLLIADEPTTALDVTVQAQILALLTDLQAETGMALILITHDLGVVAEVADDVCVMYAGRIVERAAVGRLFARPRHPYTRALLQSVPDASKARARLPVIPGAVPDPVQFPRGCRFHPRCGVARVPADGRRPVMLPPECVDGAPVLRRCVEDHPEEPGGDPPLREVEPGHFVACWEADE